MAISRRSTVLAAAGDLKRSLGFRSPFCVAIGLVVAQNVMVALLNGAGQGGWAFLAVLLFAYLLTLCYASSFAELALMFPRAGTLSTYSAPTLRWPWGTFRPSWRPSAATSWWPSSAPPLN